MELGGISKTPQYFEFWTCHTFWWVQCIFLTSDFNTVLSYFNLCKFQKKSIRRLKVMTSSNRQMNTKIDKWVIPSIVFFAHCDDFEPVITFCLQIIFVWNLHNFNYSHRLLKSEVFRKIHRSIEKLWKVQNHKIVKSDTQ